jgi:hypothetical protein
MTEGMATICPIPEQQVWGETVWSVQTQGLGLQLLSPQQGFMHT